MPLFELDRLSRATSYAVSSTTAVGALTQLRQQTFPQLIHPPQFIPRTRELPSRPEWLTGLLQYLRRRMVAAGLIAAFVLVVATAIPAWAALQQGSASVASIPLHSSAGVTGTSATRTEDLGVTTFIGQIPFVQHLNYLSSLGGVTSEAQLFIDGARQAGIADYVQDVGVQVTLPYVSSAIATKNAIDAWVTAVAESERLAAVELQQQAVLRLETSRAIWQSAGPIPGTRIPGASVTFYSCIDNGFCGLTASGAQVYAGVAACSYDLPFGTRFVIANDPTRSVFVCLDRGALPNTWVDVWFYDAADGWAWQALVGGSRSDIIIVE